MTADHVLSAPIGILVLAALLAGCSHAPSPDTQPRPEPAEATEAAEAPEASPVTEPVPPAVEEAPADEAVPSVEAVTERNSREPAGAANERPARDATVIAVGDREPPPRSLWEAAVAARERRADAPRPRISVTDENLHEFQDAELTVASPRARAPGEGEGAEEGGGEAARGEEYWRSAVLDLRLRLRAAVDELAVLEERAAELRRSFYAQDDPYVRDGEIKPAWDRSLDRIGEVRREILDLYRTLEDTLEEGRRAGALPGWLREGLELEPEPEELPRPREAAHEPGEPEVMEIEGPPGR